MSVSPDPAEVSAPRDPADYRPHRVLGPGFWVMIAFSVLCVAAGAAVVAFGPRWLAHRPQAASTAPAGRPAAAPPSGSAVGPAVPPVQTALAPSVVPAGADIGRLAVRLAAVEQAQARTAEVAATALAASALVEASQSSQPFPRELAGLAAVSTPTDDLAALRPLADSGAPSRAALAASFPDYAARAASASRAPGEGAGLLAQVRYALTRVITLRRVGDVPGRGADAVLARAERLVEDGDVDRALKALDALPPAVRDAVAPWRARAERRTEIDRRVGALRARALQELAQIARRAG
ncbi:COG4223 family protein [Phenylobacterium sp.]|jgi:hypothetical protein|uniref:COG4223 family protein n=1 Tax=Phenylobacterium sp. TaxID=1871053 RepID=UPI002F40F341